MFPYQTNLINNEMISFNSGHTWSIHKYGTPVGPWTHIDSPKPADREGGIWVKVVNNLCRHNPNASYGVCYEPIKSTWWRFVKN